MNTSRSRIEVIAFFDWYNLLMQVDEKEDLSLSDRTRLALKRGCRLIEQAILLEHNGMARVKIRFYGGWSKGFARTDFYKALIGLREVFDPNGLFRSDLIDVTLPFEFGDRLLEALPKRIHSSLMVHLPNTSRDQNGRGRRSEKMVDTALAADVCWTAINEPRSWAVVVSNDDDMIPPVMYAEALLDAEDGRSMLIHGGARLKSSRYLSLDGIVYDRTDFA